MGYSDSVKTIRTQLGLNQTEFAKKLGVSRSIISEFESGSRSPSKDFIVALPNLGVSVDWFLTGEGSMFMQEHLEDVPLEHHKLSKRPERALVNRESDDIAFVNFYPQTVGAGPGQDIAEYHDLKQIPVIRKFILPWRPEQIRALEARGDSMTKIGLFPGDIVLYTPEIREGDGVFVIAINNSLQVKRIEFDILGEFITIISENDRYQPRTLKGSDAEHVKIEGRVVGWLHRHPY